MILRFLCCFFVGCLFPVIFRLLFIKTSFQMTKNFFAGLCLAGIFALSSCTTYQRTMTDSNSRVNFTSKDFAITPSYGGFAQQTRILGIDWARLFTHKEGSVNDGMGGANGFSI